MDRGWWFGVRDSGRPPLTGVSWCLSVVQAFDARQDVCGPDGRLSWTAFAIAVPARVRCALFVPEGRDELVRSGGYVRTVPRPQRR